MAFWSKSAAIEADKTEVTVWADDDDHTKEFGAQALGFYQWNVNLFYRFPACRLAYEGEFEADEAYSVQDSATMIIQVIDSSAKALSEASISFNYFERRFGDPDEGWDYEYKSSVTNVSWGGEKFAVFNGMKFIINSKTKKNENLDPAKRLDPLRSAAIIYWFRPVPSKNMVNLGYSTSFSVREVFHFGLPKSSAATKQAQEEKAAKDAAEDAAQAASEATSAAVSAIGNLFGS